MNESIKGILTLFWGWGWWAPVSHGLHAFVIDSCGSAMILGFGGSMQIGPPANVIVMTPVPTVVLFPGSIVTQRLRDQLRPGFSLLDLVSMQCFNLRREHSQAKTEYLEML